ncbi:MAG: hypothetical protein M1832_005178 [Thelocarpon impressellum]|nr:MAG: hypothetical protein M1832_005178 [Thelocarpon impressellum]
MRHHPATFFDADLGTDGIDESPGLEQTSRFSEQLDLERRPSEPADREDQLTGPSASEVEASLIDVGPPSLPRSVEVRRGRPMLSRSPFCFFLSALARSPAKSPPSGRATASPESAGTPPMLTPRRLRRIRPSRRSDTLSDSEPEEIPRLERRSPYAGPLDGSTLVDVPSSPPVPVERHDRSTISEYSPHPAARVHVSSPTLPAPFDATPGDASFDVGPATSPQPSPQHSSYRASSPSAFSPGGSPEQETSLMPIRSLYRTRPPLFGHPSSSPSSGPPPRPYSPSSSPPPTPYTPRRSMRIYDDDAPPSTQPQTPSRRQMHPFDPAYTAPAGSLRDYRSPSTMRQFQRRRHARSGSPPGWAAGDAHENLDALIEAGRWERRARREMRGRRGSAGGAVDEGSLLQRTPERELRLGS